MKKENFTAIIPARNEHESLAIVIPFLVNVSHRLDEVIIVVDSQEDSTFLVEKEFRNLAVPVRIILNRNPGVLGAINAGVANAKNEILIVCAADEILPLLKIDAISEVLSSGYDFVTCTRYSKGGRRYGGKKIPSSLSLVANLALRVRYRNKLSDFTTGYKGFKKTKWTQLSFGADGLGWSCALKFSINAIGEKMLISEVPIISVDRQSGGSSTYLRNVWIKAYLKMIFMKKIRKF